MERAAKNETFGDDSVQWGRLTAAAPPGLQQGSPFGQSIAALVFYLHYAHAIGMERLAMLMDELF